MGQVGRKIEPRFFNRIRHVMLELVSNETTMVDNGFQGSTDHGPSNTGCCQLRR